jgi:thiol-disulfide isomerase/thioredoxin
MKNYPDSEVGRDLITDAISKEKDTAKQIALYEKELKKETPKNEGSFSGMHRQLFELYAAKKNSSKALYHAPKFSNNDDSPYKPESLKMVAQTLLDNNIALDSARAYAQRSLAMADKFPTGIIRHFPETGHILPYANDSTRKAVFERSSANLLSMIGLIDMKAGQLQSADENITKALKLSADKETLDNATAFYKETGRNDKLQELQVLREKLLQEKLAKQRINKPAPVLNTFVDMKGNPVPPETWKNKILIIDFWATWCIPCMEEMPYLQKIYDKYKDNPAVAFLVVNSGARNTLADAQGWSGHKKYSFPVYYNTDGDIGDKFKFNIIPATYIINKEGNIQFANIGFEGAEVETKLKLQIETVLKN